MKTIKQLTTLFFFVIGSTIASANGLTIKQLNELVEQTNFIVNGGCSGTLIDLKNKLILTNYHCIDTNIEIVEKEISNIDGIVKKGKKLSPESVKKRTETYKKRFEAGMYDIGRTRKGKKRGPYKKKEITQ